ncbi:MAG: nucleotide pyrophosphatase [Myxococcales bacterium]|nr:MAG: nucleotide pyrophosphatase [Myxococcales bacterium]
MRAERLSLFVFLDAFGWEILQSVEFFPNLLPHRRRLRSILGYSSACVPSILTGKTPAEHGHFSFYFYNPESSPFKWLYPLRVLPRALASRARVRNKISQALKGFYGYTGYFQIYNMPFRYFHLFDYCEKKSLFEPDGMIHGDNIFALLRLSGIPHHVSDWRRSEDDNHDAALAAIRERQVAWIFNYNADLDGLLHVHGVGSEPVLSQIDRYRQRLARLFAEAEECYRDLDIYVFSDHGQANTTANHPLWREIDALGFRFGRDYAAVYDSTMARFWFMNQDARAAITARLSAESYGRIMPRAELEALGAYFPDAKYGELFFLVDEGHLLVPSFMGERPIVGMHGYHPDASSAYAMLLSNHPIPDDVQAITDLYTLMAAPALTWRGRETTR